jgi:hypothetical protein
MYGYDQKQFMFFRSGGVDLEVDVEAGAADKGYISVPIPITVVGFGLMIVDEVVNYDNATPTEAVVSLDYRFIEDSDAAAHRTEIATITIPGNAALESMAIGEVLMSRIPIHNGGFNCDPGGQLVLEQKVAGVGSTETGEYKAFIVYHERGEVAGNFHNTVTVVES